MGYWRVQRDVPRFRCCNAQSFPGERCLLFGYGIRHERPQHALVKTSLSVTRYTRASTRLRSSNLIITRSTSNSPLRYYFEKSLEWGMFLILNLVAATNGFYTLIKF